MITGSVRADSGGAFEPRLLAGVTYAGRAGIRMEKGFRQTEAVVYVNQRLDGLRLSIALCAAAWWRHCRAVANSNPVA